MGIFQADNVVEPLDYDFTAMSKPPHNIKELAGVAGRIAEPTTMQVQTFLTANVKEMQRLRKEAAERNGGVAPDAGAADDAPGVVTDKMLALMADVDPRKVEAAKLRQAKIYAALCSNEPTVEQIMLLPHRIMLAFGEWLTKEVMDPEAVTGAGKPPLQIVRSSAAG